MEMLETVSESVFICGAANLFFTLFLGFFFLLFWVSWRRRESGFWVLLLFFVVDWLGLFCLARFGFLGFFGFFW